MIGVLFLLRHFPVLLQFFAGVVSYILALFLFRSFNDEEIRLLRGALSGLLSRKK